ncbi:MAG: nucleoside deaminase [Wenzhouxiangellaceae bacterium]
MIRQSFQIKLPQWCIELAASLPDTVPTIEDRMALAIELSRQNVENETGGPFGAVVAGMESGKIIALGVNRVEPQSCSSAHAEIVALSLAQQRLGTWNLAEAMPEPLELVTSCEPCAMCLGAIPWSGVRRVICGATKQHAEETGFDEGARDPAWREMLNHRGIELQTAVLHEQAAEVLRLYQASGARIYNP